MRDWALTRTHSEQGPRILYQDWEAKFATHEASLSLAKRKAALEAIRSLKGRPINGEELEEHALRYEDEREARLEERRAEREARE